MGFLIKIYKRNQKDNNNNNKTNSITYTMGLIFSAFPHLLSKRNQKDRSINNCFNKSNFLSERDQYMLIKLIDTCVQIREIINNGLT